MNVVGRIEVAIERRHRCSSGAEPAASAISALASRVGVDPTRKSGEPRAFAIKTCGKPRLRNRRGGRASSLKPKRISFEAAGTRNCREHIAGP